MKLNIDSLYNKDRENIEFSISENVEFMTLYGVDYKLKSPVKISGKVSRAGKNYILKANVKFDYLTECSRCLIEVEEPVDYNINAYLMRETYDEDDFEDSDVFKIEGTDIDLIPIIDSTISYNFPQRVLCSEECKGICSGCGVDLNKEICKCEDSNDVSDIDPRFLKLKELLK